MQTIQTNYTEDSTIRVETNGGAWFRIEVLPVGNGKYRYYVRRSLSEALELADHLTNESSQGSKRP